MFTFFDSSASHRQIYLYKSWNNHLHCLINYLECVSIIQTQDICSHECKNGHNIVENFILEKMTDEINLFFEFCCSAYYTLRHFSFPQMPQGSYERKWDSLVSSKISTELILNVECPLKPITVWLLEFQILFRNPRYTSKQVVLEWKLRV